MADQITTCAAIRLPTDDGCVSETVEDIRHTAARAA